MRRRPVMTILLIVIAMILTLPVRAQQKPVAPTFRSACADLKVSATTVPARRSPPRHRREVTPESESPLNRCTDGVYS
jgi:hypothetical protein